MHTVGVKSTSEYENRVESWSISYGLVWITNVNKHAVSIPVWALICFLRRACNETKINFLILSSEWIQDVGQLRVNRMDKSTGMMINYLENIIWHNWF